MKIPILMVLAAVLVVGAALILGGVGCAPRGVTDPPTGAPSYFYDEQHKVGIWFFPGQGVAVLPASQIASPEKPARFIIPGTTK